MNHTTELPKGRILVVDDTPSNVKILIAILDDDYNLTPAYSGEEALRLAQEHKPDLILLDVTMPKMSGLEVCIKLKATVELRDIPVIFITARDEVQDETRGFEVGGVDYLAKPVSKPIVRARVRTHLELKRHRDFLERLSTLDGLTGIPNRRHYDTYFDQEWHRCVRGSQPISLLMIDIDCFKKFNDRYGHMEGDDCLRSVAIALAKTPLRPSDFVARYGGEEFSAVLPETDFNGAMMLAEQMRASIETLNIPHEENAACSHVTVSVGFATILPLPDMSADDLKKQADIYLYHAKSEGRNRVLGVDLN